MLTKPRAPVTAGLARFISLFTAEKLPEPVLDYVRLLVFHGVGALFAAIHPSMTASRGIGDYAVASGGPREAT